jgi:lipoprotein-releasing system permease protein
MPAMSLIVDIAWTHVSTRVRQTLVGTLGVAMGVGFTIMMAGIMQGSQVDFLRQLVDAMPHITVSDERRSLSTQPAELQYGAVSISNAANVNRRPGIRNPDSIVTSLETWVPGAVAPSARTNAIISQGTARLGVTLTGIDPKTEARVSKLATQMREGELTDLSKAPNAIVIGEGIADKLAIKTGNSISLASGDIAISATVVGIFRTGMKQVDESNVYALTRLAQILLGQSGLINQLKIRLKDPLLAQQIAAQVESQVGYKAVSWEESNADLLGTFAVRDFIMMTVMAAMLLVSSFATYNIISTITYEKRHDIAIMKSLGMREYKVRNIFVLEAAMIGAVGIVLGWVLGYALCFGLGKITVYNPISGATLPLEIYYSLWQYIVAGGISIVCCAGAAFFPARKATRVNPVEIIRGAS